VHPGFLIGDPALLPRVVTLFLIFRIAQILQSDINIFRVYYYILLQKLLFIYVIYYVKFIGHM
jgi:hypothetical protein